jgi:predicted nucleotidyltransferase
MDIKTINDLSKVIKSKKIVEKYGLKNIGIFGSFARGENANDIDFYIDSETYNLKELLNLKKELELITQKEVDIMLKKYANPIVLHRAQKDMIYVTL